MEDISEESGKNLSTELKKRKESNNDYGTFTFVKMDAGKA